jgi:hypothetical protein
MSKYSGRRKWFPGFGFFTFAEVGELGVNVLFCPLTSPELLLV